MVQVSFLRPTSQPRGSTRLISELEANLACQDFDELRIIVAFAKLGPLLRLLEHITKWNASGRSIKAIFGVDLRGTSRQALEFALAHFQEKYVVLGGAHSVGTTFHPKVYFFCGPQRAVCYLGSNNLTVGGTETNLECYVKLDLQLPADEGVRTDLLGCWDDALEVSRNLDAALLSQLVTAGLVLDERQMRGTGPTRTSHVSRSASVRSAFPKLPAVPPSPIPRRAAASYSRGRVQRRPVARGRTLEAPSPSIGAEALVIQIIPHHNGEVFLSKSAVDQDPAFFGWPFTGETVPKKSTNPSYPQRVPDPVVNLNVYDSSCNVIIRHESFQLNTVYYASKSEIRITVPQDVVQSVPEYSIMVMRQSNEGYDYDIDVYLEGSEDYTRYLTACNQTMPSGGKPVARRFGWI